MIGKMFVYKRKKNTVSCSDSGSLSPLYYYAYYQDRKMNTNEIEMSPRKRARAEKKWKCPNWNCQFGGYGLNSYQMHQDMCGFRNVLCACKENVPKYLLDFHKENYCVAEIVSCQFCSEPIQKFRLYFHYLQECDRCLLTCKSCGMEGFTRTAIKLHQDQLHGICKFYTDVCPFGCVGIPRDQMNAHLEQNIVYHAVVQLTFSKQIITGMNDIRGRLKSLEERVNQCMSKEMNILPRSINRSTFSHLAMAGNITDDVSTHAGRVKEDVFMSRFYISPNSEQLSLAEMKTPLPRGLIATSPPNHQSDERNSVNEEVPSASADVRSEGRFFMPSLLCVPRNSKQLSLTEMNTAMPIAPPVVALPPNYQSDGASTAVALRENHQSNIVPAVVALSPNHQTDQCESKSVVKELALGY